MTHRAGNRPAPGQTRSLVVSLHDVSPLTHADCARVLDELGAIGLPCSSLLIVPNHHHKGHIRDDPAFMEWLLAQASAGHEVLVHGYHHSRPCQERENLHTKLTTRLYTAGEGEFYDLDRSAAASLVAQAGADFRNLGLEPSGFIAPAWLLSAEAEQALRDLDYEYTTRLGSVVDLRMGRIYRSQSLVWSTRSGWRRLVSLAWNRFLFLRLASNPLLRVSIHPVDIRHPRVWQQIRKIVARALADREPVTYLAWLARQRHAAPH